MLMLKEMRSDIKEAQLFFSCLHILYVLLSSLQIDEQLVQCSGKFLILDRLLPALKKRGHKVKLHTRNMEPRHFMSKSGGFIKSSSCLVK